MRPAVQYLETLSHEGQIYWTLCLADPDESNITLLSVLILEYSIHITNLFHINSFI